MLPAAARAQDGFSFGGGFGSTGQPQLNETIIRDNIAFFEFALGVKFTSAQQSEFRRHLQNLWNSGRPETIQNVSGASNLLQQLQGMPPAERAAVLLIARPEMLANNQKLARAGNPDSKWLMDIFFAAHPMLAPGVVPLTRETVDGLIEAERFLQRILHGKNVPPPSATQKAKIYKSVAADWGRQSPEKQMALAKRAGEIAMVKAKWAKMDETERLMMRVQLGGGTPRERQMAARMQQQLRSHQMGMIQNEINFMRRSQNIIMGSGPYWNPSANRWEQRGGVVTEYH
jgi:hypothetical protein